MSGHTGHGLPLGDAVVLMVLSDGDPEQREEEEEESCLK